MLKKILLGLLILVLILAGWLAYTFLTTKNHSPVAVASYSDSTLSIKVDYCQPFKKGRLIFGTEENEALQPYGSYWRIGANEATQITFSSDIIFCGEPLEAGAYWLYAFPGEEFWEIGLNSELGKWGAFPPEPENDVLRVKVKSEQLTPISEQLTIDFRNKGKMIYLQIKWDNVMVPIPILKN
ncbi:MAG: hypothetical protein ACJATA_000776 [Sphingobacteriales bacterium]|jgi:hypothetical protein